jgi:hypothetical protein
MTCEACAKAATNPHSGRYHFGCLECCTRLVVSTHPSKQHAAAMLAAIARFRDAPGRDAILESVRQCLAKRQSAGPKSTTQ